MPNIADVQARLADPLVMTASAASAILRSLHSPDPRSAVAALALGAKAPAATGGSVAVLSVHGPLMAHADWMGEWFGWSSYEQISAELQAVLGDPSIQAVLLDIDSPGGVCAGLYDLCDQIRAATKPVHARASGMACSAAYAIGSSCARFTAGPAAELGSIGVIVSHVDESAFNEKLGFRVTNITSGTAKGDGASDAPLTAESRARIQARVDDLAEVFFARVALTRNLPASKVRGLQAGLRVGAAAVAEGLIDEITTFDAAIRGAAMAAQEGVRRMSVKTPGTQQITSPSPQIPAELPASAAATSGAPIPPVVVDVEQLRLEARADGARSERARIVDIDRLSLRGHKTLADKAKSEGMSVQDFLLAQTTAEQSAQAAHLAVLAATEAAVAPVAKHAPAPATEASAETAARAAGRAAVKALRAKNKTSSVAQ